MVVSVLSSIKNHRPAILSRMFSLIIRPLASSYRSYSLFSRPNSFTSSWPLTESVSFRMPLISSLQAWASPASFHRRLPAIRVGRVNSGTTAMPIRASSQFFWNMAITATIRVMVLDKMLVNVFVTTLSTPLTSLVIRVMMSPWLAEVKNRWLIFCRCRYIWFRMS